MLSRETVQMQRNIPINSTSSSCSSTWWSLKVIQAQRHFSSMLLSYRATDRSSTAERAVLEDQGSTCWKLFKMQARAA